MRDLPRPGKDHRAARHLLTTYTRRRWTSTVREPRRAALGSGDVAEGGGPLVRGYPPDRPPRFAPLPTLRLARSDKILCSGGSMDAPVGAQWELRCRLARRDQRFARAFGLGRYTSARSNALRRDPRPPFRLLFERVPAASAPDGKIG